MYKYILEVCNIPGVIYVRGCVKRSAILLYGVLSEPLCILAIIEAVSQQNIPAQYSDFFRTNKHKKVLSPWVLAENQHHLPHVLLYDNILYYMNTAPVQLAVP